MRKSIVTSVCLIAGLLATDLAHAQRVALSARVGTLGPGLEVTAGLTPRLNARVGGQYLTYSRRDHITNLEVEIQSDTDLTLTSVTALLDWFPFKKVVRLTGGVVYNRNEVTALVTPMESYTVQDKTFSPERIGTLSAKVGHKSQFNPYVGLGFGNAVRPGKRLGITFDLGVLYTDSPKVEMSGTGMIAPTANQASKLEAGFAGIKLYPLVSLGLSYKL